MWFNVRSQQVSRYLHISTHLCFISALQLLEESNNKACLVFYQNLREEFKKYIFLWNGEINFSGRVEEAGLLKEIFYKKIYLLNPSLRQQNWLWKYKMLDKILIMLLALCLCKIVSSDLNEIIDNKVWTQIIKSSAQYKL